MNEETQQLEKVREALYSLARIYREVGAQHNNAGNYDACLRMNGYAAQITQLALDLDGAQYQQRPPLDQFTELEREVLKSLVARAMSNHEMTSRICSHNPLIAGKADDAIQDLGGIYDKLVEGDNNHQ